MPWLLLVYGAGAAVLLLVWAATGITGRSFGHFSRDPASVGRGLEYYTGALSYLTVLVWWTGAVVAVFTGLACRRDPRAVPLVTGGALMGWLGLDDLYMLHEAFFPRRGVSERGLIASYGAAALLWSVVFRDFIRRSEWPLLLSAAALFVAATVFDVAHLGVEWEDGAKFLAVLGLAAFFVRTSSAVVRRDPVTRP
jgi:hypothetical protein